MDDHVAIDHAEELSPVIGSARPPHAPGAPLYAALDLGTSNCRLMVAAEAPGGLRVVDSFSRVVRLGEGLSETGLLGDAAMARTIEALDICARRLARRRLAGFAAVATEACRRAANGPAFLARVRAETGIAIRLITPREEAGLVIESCANLLEGGGRRALLFDIGGGSTELAWVRLAGSDGAAMHELIGTASLPFGVVTLADAIGVDPHDPNGFDEMVATVADWLLEFEAVHRIGHEIRVGGVRFLGTSGTVTTLAGETLGLGRYQRALIDGTVLAGGDAANAVARFRALDGAALARHPCVGVDRAPLLLPGCAIFEAIRRQWGLREIVVADRGLREGMVLRMIRQAQRPPQPPHRAHPARAHPARNRP